jgi:hypothetical protein
MEFQPTEPADECCDACLDYAPESAAEFVAAGLPGGVSQALADPIVQALMAADRVDPKRVEALVRRMAEQLGRRRLQGQAIGSPEPRGLGVEWHE